jgi:hypothetical protein
VTQYFDRALFERELSVFTIIDFNGLTPGLLENSIFGDATVASTNNTGVFATNDFGAPTVQIGSQNTGGLRVSLQPGYNALGMDIGELIEPAIFSFTLTLSSGPNVTGSMGVTDNDNLGLPGTTFFGYISDSADILSLEFIGPSSYDFETIDNLTFGTAVPEPTTALLSALALACIGLQRRR